MKHVLDITDLSVEEIGRLITVAEDIIRNAEQYQDICKRKKLAALFFEPSTRTRLSFEAAMLELGGSVIGFSSAASSSSAKGESVSDTVKVVSYYADIIAMRHPKEGAPVAAAAVSNVPIINAGDGGHNHPTQTLADLLTIHREKGRFRDHYCRLLRGFEIWTHRAFSRQRPVPLYRDPPCFYFTGRIENPSLYQNGYR